MRTAQDEVTIRLSAAQVADVVHAAQGARSPALAVLHALPAAGVRGGERIASGGDGRLSRSLLRGLSLLGRVAAEGERGILELARELDMSPSTAHRYAQTLLALGLLERAPDTRRYRLSLSAAAGCERCARG